MTALGHVRLSSQPRREASNGTSWLLRQRRKRRSTGSLSLGELCGALDARLSAEPAETAPLLLLLLLLLVAVLLLLLLLLLLSSTAGSAARKAAFVLCDHADEYQTCSHKVRCASTVSCTLPNHSAK
jgi:hypothetical protein